MPNRGITDIDRELSALSTVHTDIRRRGGEVTTIVIDGLLDERLMLHTAPNDPPTEEIDAIRLPGSTSR